MFVGLEGDLEHSVPKSVSIQRLDGNHSFIVIGHGHKTKALAFIGLQIPDDFDVLDGAEWSEQLPENVLLGLRREVVDEQAPAGAVECRARQQGVTQEILTSARRVPVGHATVPDQVG